jgi:hypothetical protein
MTLCWPKVRKYDDEFKSFSSSMQQGIDAARLDHQPQTQSWGRGINRLAHSMGLLEYRH